MYDFIGMLKEFFGLGKSAIDFQRDKLAQKNTDGMKQAAEAQREAAATDQTRTAIAKKDLNELRNEASE